MIHSCVLWTKACNSVCHSLREGVKSRVWVGLQAEPLCGPFVPGVSGQDQGTGIVHIYVCLFAEVCVFPCMCVFVPVCLYVGLCVCLCVCLCMYLCGPFVRECPAYGTTTNMAQGIHAIQQEVDSVLISQKCKASTDVNWFFRPFCRSEERQFWSINESQKNFT